jgi:formate hydrogenlyase subunit 6/NADH:ubiquinone oxidoreductase subunit I/flavodoxin
VSLEIYYFSGTGNSLVLARSLAEKLGGELISVSSVIDRTGIKTQADEIGIVFPAYMAQMYGVPLIVERFIRKLEDIDLKYLFCVCTCGGYENFNALPAMKNLGKLMKNLGGKLSAEYSMKLPMNNQDYSLIPTPIEKDPEVILKQMPAKIDYICSRLKKRKKDSLWIVKILLNWFFAPMYALLKRFYITAIIKYAKEPKDTKKTWRELMPLTDRSYSFNDNCNGCAACTKVCPVKNIIMQDHRPAWQGRCELCLACAEFCPEKAIHNCWRPDGNHYHHPEVTVADLMKQSKQR